MHVFKHIAIGLVATALLLLAKIGFEHTSLGRSWQVTARIVVGVEYLTKAKDSPEILKISAKRRDP